MGRSPPSLLIDRLRARPNEVWGQSRSNFIGQEADLHEYAGGSKDRDTATVISGVGINQTDVHALDPCGNQRERHMEECDHRRRRVRV